MKTVILLTGYARSGKDTVADLLYWNYGFERFKFAQPLYDMAVAMYSGKYGVEDFEKMKAKDEYMPGLNVTVREFLQKLGTEFGREMLQNDIWVKIAKEKASDCDKIVVSDCRFPNEVCVFNDDPEYKTEVWCLEREESQPQTHHASEQYIEYIKENYATAVIDNNGTIDDLVVKIIELCNKLSDNPLGRNY